MLCENKLGIPYPDPVPVPGERRT
ncbi:hypothetical protein KGM_204058A, partial [Danaus plexippus plexippus]